MSVERLLRTKGSAVVTIRPDATLADVTHELAVGNFGALIVSEDGRSVNGIISERDVVRTLANEGASALDRKVRDVMTTEVVTCAPSDRVDDMMEVMSNRRFRHLPVVRDGELCGVISMTDLMRKRLDDIEHEANAMRDFIAGR
jgi:CBS domain-containing protein